MIEHKLEINGQMVKVFCFWSEIDIQDMYNSLKEEKRVKDFGEILSETLVDEIIDELESSFDAGLGITWKHIEESVEFVLNSQGK